MVGHPHRYLGYIQGAVAVFTNFQWNSIFKSYGALACSTPNSLWRQECRRVEITRACAVSASQNCQAVSSAGAKERFRRTSSSCCCDAIAARGQQPLQRSAADGGRWRVCSLPPCAAPSHRPVAKWRQCDRLESVVTPRHEGTATETSAPWSWKRPCTSLCAAAAHSCRPARCRLSVQLYSSGQGAVLSPAAETGLVSQVCTTDV